MSIQMNDSQLVLLSAASQRDDHCLTLPIGPQLAQARKAANKLLAAGLVREVRARKNAPIWRREEETDRALALKLTAAGLKAIAADAEEAADEPRLESSAEDAQTTPTRHVRQGVGGISPELRTADAPHAEPRDGTKIADVIKMLGGPEGATIDALVTATG